VCQSLGIIIVTFNSAETIGRCLASLKDNAVEEQILIIDNASKDNTIEIAKASEARATVVANRENVGFSAACNIGLTMCQADLVLFLNPDTIVRPLGIARLRTFLAENRDHVGVGPSVFAEDGQVQRACARRDLTLWRVACQLFWLDQRWPRSRVAASRYYQPFDYNQPIDVECLSGAAMMMRMDAVRRVGGFDETVPLYLDDIDLCRRIRAFGRLAFLPDAAVVHTHNVSGRVLGERAVRLLSLDAGFVYTKRFLGTGAALVYRVLVMLGALQAFIACLAARSSSGQGDAKRLYERGSAYLEWCRSPINAGSRRWREFNSLGAGSANQLAAKGECGELAAVSKVGVSEEAEA
jgi:N-acetylglucosaminyl-diphospho-decaprenol L-rhamnosyltransferase